MTLPDDKKALLSTVGAANVCGLNRRQFLRVAGYMNVKGTLVNTRNGRQFLWRQADVQRIREESAACTNWRKRLSGY